MIYTTFFHSFPSAFTENIWDPKIKKKVYSFQALEFSSSHLLNTKLSFKKETV